MGGKIDFFPLIKIFFFNDLVLLIPIEEEEKTKRKNWTKLTHKIHSLMGLESNYEQTRCANDLSETVKKTSVTFIHSNLFIFFIFVSIIEIESLEFSRHFINAPVPMLRVWVCMHLSLFVKNKKKKTRKYRKRISRPWWISNYVKMFEQKISHKTNKKIKSKTQTELFKAELLSFRI